MATYNIKTITLPNGDVCNLKDSRNIVTGVKGNSETTYRTGDINITAANIGLGNVIDGAEVNQNAFSNVAVGSTTIAASSETDTIQLEAGTNITLTPDVTNKKITISAGAIPITGSSTTWYGTSSTAAGTAAKVVSCDIALTTSTLQAGTIVSILFSTANTAATPTLNINNIGAKSIYVGSGTLNATTNVLKWSANTLLTFMYDGENFRYISSVAAASVVPPDGAGTWYGTCSTTATTQAKTSTITNFRLMPGAFVVLRCTTANTYATAKITLNINSTGAKDVYTNNAVTSATNTLLWDVGDVLTFVYDGSYYRFVSSDRASKKADDLFKIVEYQYAYTLAANTGANIASTDLGIETPSGYVPFSFANVLTGNAGVVIRSMQPRLVGTSTAILSLRNVTSASVSATVTVQMIYVKSGTIAS